MIYSAFREIVLADEVIYCMLMPVMSSIQMEIALRFDSILRIATGAVNVRTLLCFLCLKMRRSGFLFLPTLPCTLEPRMTQFLPESDCLIDILMDR